MDLRLRDWLHGWAPDELVASLSDDPGWQVRSATTPLQWRPAGLVTSQGDLLTQVWVAGNALEATVSARRVPGHRAGVWQVTLCNRAPETSPPLSVLDPLVMAYPGASKERLTVQTMGGGMANAFYPSPSYAVRACTAAEGDCEPLRIETAADGRSSNKDLPFLVHMVDGTGVVTALDWSGEWHQTVELAWLGPGWAVKAGVPVRDLRLEPGETLALPAAHLIFFEGDLLDGGNACRRYLYDCIVPLQTGEKPMPRLAYSHWFTIRLDYDEAMLRRQVDRAAELGCEYYILDAGWYAGTRAPTDFSAGVGNWRHDPGRFPNGIEPFAEYVRSRGLKFGLWIEFERAHCDSDSVRAHPEWYWDIGAKSLHLDLSIPEAQDWVIETVGGLIRRLGLRWLRYDYNFGPRPYWQQVDPSGKVMFRYFEGLYKTLDRLLREYPDVLIEAAAGGGRRTDLAMLRYSHTSWLSDHNEDAHIGRYMLCGANRLLPGHVLNSPVTVLGIGVGDNGMTDMNVVSRFPGTMLFSGDIASWSSRWTQRVRELVSVYRSLRHLLVEDFYPLTPQPARPDEPEAVEFVARTGDEALVLAYRMRALPLPSALPLRGLDPAARYEVTDPVGQAPRAILGGAQLQSRGLELDVPPQSALVRHLRKL